MASGNPTVTTKLLSEDVSLSSGLEKAEGQLDELARSFGDTYEDITPDLEAADQAIADLDARIERQTELMESLAGTVRGVMSAYALFKAAEPIFKAINEAAEQQEQRLREFPPLIADYLHGWNQIKRTVNDTTTNISKQANFLADFFGGMVGLDFSPPSDLQVADPELDKILKERARLYKIMGEQMKIVRSEEKKSTDTLEKLIAMQKSLVANRERMLDSGVRDKDIQDLMVRTQRQISRITAERWAKDIEAREKALEQERKLAQAESERHKRAIAAAGRRMEVDEERVRRAEKRIEDIEFSRRQFFERDRGFRSESFSDPAALARRLQGSLFDRADNARQQQLERLDRRLREAREQHRELIKEQQENTTNIIRALGVPLVGRFI